MATQTLILSSTSFTPKLATFNSLTATSTRTFTTSSSLPKPSLQLKASNIQGVRPLHTSQFKCYASIADENGVSIIHGVTNLGGFEPIKDVEHNEEVQALGKFAVDEHNKKEKTNIKFMRVVEAESQLVAGWNYRLWIEGEEDKVDKVFKALVFVGLPVRPQNLESFTAVEWANKLILPLSAKK